MICSSELMSLTIEGLFVYMVDLDGFMHYIGYLLYEILLRLLFMLASWQLDFIVGWSCHVDSLFMLHLSLLVIIVIFP